MLEEHARRPRWEDPMMPQQQQDTSYLDHVVERLREQYLRHVALPAGEGKRLSLTDFYRLYSHLLAEGYGR
jgi:hypothetical protein